MIPTDRQVNVKLTIYRPNGDPVDVTEYVKSAEVELGSIEQLGTDTGADIGVRSMTFVLANDGTHTFAWYITDSMGQTGDILGDTDDVLGAVTDDAMDWLETLLGEATMQRNSFAPRDKTSSWNTVGGRWEPLLWPYRGVTCEVAVTEVNGTPTEWATLFEGYLGDNITTEHHSVSVSCRDKSKRLQDAYIDIPKTYDSGPYAAEELIQAIINDYVDEPLELHCPVPSGITFDEMKVEYISVWDAIQNVAGQMGWFLGYRWNGQAYVLTLMEPPRNKATADYHFDWEDDIYHETLDIADTDIRNALTLTFRDGGTGERVTLNHRDYPQLRNDGSIDEYTRRIMEIEEADTSLIDSMAKAISFGEKIIWDLSELSATDRLDLPLFPQLDIFSTFTVENPLVSSTVDFYAVQSIRHSMTFGENGRFRTEVIATGRVVGAKSRWLDGETRPGRPGEPDESFLPPPPVSHIDATEASVLSEDGVLNLAARLRWQRESRARVHQQILQRAETTEIITEDELDFSHSVMLDKDTLEYYDDHRLETGKEYAWRVIAVSRAGIYSAGDPIASLTIGGKATAPGIPTGLIVSINDDGDVVLHWQPVVIPDLLDYVIEVATNSSFTQNRKTYYSASNTFNLTGMYADQVVYVRVRARDRSHNVSPPSNVVTVNIPKLLSDRIAATYLAQQTYQKLLDHHFFGDEEGYFDGAGIKPRTVETQHLAVGAGTRNFQLVGVKMDANTDDVRGRFSNTAGYLILATDIGEDAKTWNISAKTQQQTLGQQLYVYARCSKTTTAGEIMFSTTRPALQDSSYHYFLIGMYFTNDNPAVLAVSYGFTYINGSHITTGVIDANRVRIMATGVGDSAIDISGDGIVFYDTLGHISIQMSTQTGDAYFSGVVEAEAIILPVKPY